MKGEEREREVEEGGDLVDDERTEEENAKHAEQRKA